MRIIAQSSFRKKHFPAGLTFVQSWAQRRFSLFSHHLWTKLQRVWRSCCEPWCWRMTAFCRSLVFEWLPSIWTTESLLVLVCDSKHPTQVQWMYEPTCPHVPMHSAKMHLLPPVSLKWTLVTIDTCFHLLSRAWLCWRRAVSSLQTFDSKNRGHLLALTLLCTRCSQPSRACKSRRRTFLLNWSSYLCQQWPFQSNLAPPGS